MENEISRLLQNENGCFEENKSIEFKALKVLIILKLQPFILQTIILIVIISLLVT